MKTQFKLLKNGKSAQSVWANPETKEIISAHRAVNGFNYMMNQDKEFDAKHASKFNQRQVYSGGNFYYFISGAQLQKAGWQLVKRGEPCLW